MQKNVFIHYSKGFLLLTFQFYIKSASLLNKNQIYCTFSGDFHLKISRQFVFFGLFFK